MKKIKCWQKRDWWIRIQILVEWPLKIDFKRRSKEEMRRSIRKRWNVRLKLLIILSIHNLAMHLLSLLYLKDQAPSIPTNGTSSTTTKTNLTRTTRETWDMMRRKWWETVKNILSSHIKPCLLQDLRKVKLCNLRITALEGSKAWSNHLTKDVQERVVLLESIRSQLKKKRSKLSRFL